VLEKMAGCLTPTSDYKLEDDQWLCLHDVDPAFEMFFVLFFLLLLLLQVLFLFFWYGFLWFWVAHWRYGPHKRGARHPRPSLYIYEKLLRHVCLPHCFQRFVINA
jgi:hypothetical protein